MTNDHLDHVNLIDPCRTICLCDAGQPGYLAAIAVGADGTEHLVLADKGALGEHTAPYQPDCADITHEQLGPLPPLWHARTTLAPFRCGRPTKAGRPCRAMVTQPGAACTRHSHQAAL